MQEHQQQMSQLVFDTMTGQGHEIYLYDEQGKQVFDPKQANRLWSNNQKIMIVLGETKGRPSRPLITFNLSSSTDMDRFNDLKFALKKHNIYDYSFDTQLYGRELEPKHFEHANVTESHMWTGTTRTSYFPVDGVNVVVKHNRPWRPEETPMAKRWQRIRQIMLYTADGERLRWPYKDINGARAMAQHLNQQCHMHDHAGQFIQRLVELNQNLRRLQVRAKRAGGGAVLEQILRERGLIKNFLRGIASPDTYKSSLAEAGEWSRQFTKGPSMKPETKQWPEAQQLQEWFDGFDVTHKFESTTSQVKTALEQSDGNAYRTLDYLKRNIPGWEARFEEDPAGVAKELEDTIEKIKKAEQES